jgi:cytoskeletal protein RodZ
MTRNRNRVRVGAKLKKARERGGISLRQVSDSTKIAVFVLQALERDDISNLPGGVVGRGFVRSFAAAVNLDPEVIVAEFVAQFPLDSVNDGYPAARVDGNELPDTPPSKPSFTIHRWETSTLLRFAAVGVLAAMLVAYFAFAKPWQADSPIQAAGAEESPVQVQRSAELPPQSAAPVLPVPVAVDAAANSTAKAGADSSVPPAVPPARDPTPVASSSSGAASTSTSIPSTTVAPALVAPAPSPVSVESPADAKRQELPDAAALVKEPLKVVLSVTSPSWVIATVDGKNTVSRLLDVGDEEILEASREVVLTAGDGGAIVMTLNGEAARSLGRTGQTIKVHVNRDNFKDYLRRDAP